MRFHKTTVKKKTYNLSSAGKWQTREEFVRIRKKIGLSTKDADKCFVCNHRFEDSETLYIALSGAKGTRNCFVCKKCAERINLEK